MAIPNVTPYSGQKPVPGQDQPTFNQNMSDELDYFNALPAELNTAIDAMNQTATDVDDAKAAAEAAASEAATSATAAAASGNYQGEFISGVTSATAGESYLFDGQIWLCLANTTADPSIGNSAWRSTNDYGTVPDGIEVKLRRGTNAEILAGTPAISELWFNTTDNSIHMGDGVTAGGIKHVNEKTLPSYTALTFENIAQMKLGITNGGATINMSSLPVGAKATWLGYNSRSDGGGNWGVVKSGAHTEDGLSIFSINANTYIEANMKGTINPMMAGLFGGATDLAAMQNLLDKSKGRVKLQYGVKYDIVGQLNMTNEGRELFVNKAFMNFTCALGECGVRDLNHNNSVFGGKIYVDYTPGSGGNGHAGACISTGHQDTGEGYRGSKYYRLELSTNRTDAGAHISMLGENTLFSIKQIKVPDNAVCRNIIGVEWGGTPGAGTKHPHNFNISKVNIGKITTPTYGLSGYAYAVWLSGAFNGSVSKVHMKEGYGLIMCTSGDNANEFAPDDQKDLIGTGLSIDNSSISACYGVGVRCVGKGKGSANRVPSSLKSTNITLIGKKVGANNNFGMQAEFCDGPSLSNFIIKGDFAAGTAHGASADNVTIHTGSIENCELYGSQVGSNSGSAESPVIRNVTYRKNNRLASAGSSSAAIVVVLSDNAMLEHNKFGKLGDTETQRYSIYAASNAVRPRIMHNHTYVNDNAGIDPYLIAATTAFEQDNTKSF